MIKESISKENLIQELKSVLKEERNFKLKGKDVTVSSVKFLCDPTIYIYDDAINDGDTHAFDATVELAIPEEFGGYTEKKYAISSQYRIINGTIVIDKPITIRER